MDAEEIRRIAAESARPQAALLRRERCPPSGGGRPDRGGAPGRRARCSPSATAAPPPTPSTWRESWWVASGASVRAWPPSPSPPTRPSSPPSATTSASRRCSAARWRPTGRPGDVAVGISTSGRSPNVVEALRAGARGVDSSPWASPAAGAGRLRGLVDYLIDVPHPDTPADPGGARHGRPRPVPDRRGGRRSLKARPARRRRSLPPLVLDGVPPIRWRLARARCRLRDFARPHARGARVRDFLDSVCPASSPETRCGGSPARSARARARGKPILWGLGAHVLKVGLSPVLVDLMEKGFVTGLALNGAGIVHDFELAVAGHTSEDVEAGLGAGDLRDGAGDGRGGQPRHRGGRSRRPGAGGRHRPLPRPGVARVTSESASWPPPIAWACPPPSTSRWAPTSCTCTRPATLPPSGRATHLDFRLFAAQVARLGGGGVYLNVGSAVLLPEVFLKAVTLARNLGPSRCATSPPPTWTSSSPTVPSTNVVQRPTRGVGRGYSLTGHHEILLPLLAAALAEGFGRP